MSDSHSQNIQQRLAKYAIHGAVLAGTGKLLRPDANVVRIRGNTISFPAFMFAVGAVTSIVNDAIHAEVMPHLHMSQKMEERSSTLLALLTGAGSLYGAFYIVNPSLNTKSFGTSKVLMAGASAEVASEYAFKWFQGQRLE